MARPSSERKPQILLASVFLALLVSGVEADQVWLDNGRHLVGEATVMADGRVEVVSSLGRWVLPAERVARIDKGESPEEAVKKALALLPANDTKSRFELASLCQSEGAATLARQLFTAVLAIEPDHEGARRALGYHRHQGEWLTSEQLHAARGEVWFRDRWVPSAERDRILAWETAQANAAAEARRASAHAAELASREARQAVAEERARQAPQALAWNPTCCGYPTPVFYWPSPIVKPHQVRPIQPPPARPQEPPAQRPIEHRRSRVAPPPGG